MKKIIRKITAVSAAVVMAVSALGTTVSAEKATDSWEWDEGRYMWKYCLPDGSYAGTENARQLYTIDGVTYKFSGSGLSTGKYTGWTKSSDGTRRRYSNGLPYTGWLKYKSGQMRYCLDGYIVTDNMQIGDHIYTFDEDGFYTGKTALTLITKCDKLVSSDTDMIKVAVKNLDGRDYNFGVLSKMERWEKGKWVNCWGDWKGENGEELAFVDIGYALENKGDIMELDLNPQLYTNYNFTEGYYRIPIGSWLGNYKNQYECYAMFQVVPPVEVETSEDIYYTDGFTDVNVSFTADIHSQQLIGSAVSYESTIYKMTEKGWRDITEYTLADGTVSTEQAVLDVWSDIQLTYGISVSDGIGYYKAVVKAGDREYYDYFRIAEYNVSPFLDVYSTKTDNLTVSFNIYNNTGRDMEFSSSVYDIFRVGDDGELSDASEARTSWVDVEAYYLTLEKGHRTAVDVNISQCYDISKLEAGEYAVYIDGVGYESFRLTNKSLGEKNHPFSKLEKKDVDSIKLIIHEAYKDNVAIINSHNSDKVIRYLRQFRIGSEVKDYDVPAGGAFEIIIAYADGAEESLLFNEDEVVLRDGKRFECSKYVYGVLHDYAVEILLLDKDYYGYRTAY